MSAEWLGKLKGDVHAAVKPLRKPAARINLPLPWAEAYPREIADSAALAARRDFAGLKRDLPNLEQR